MDLGARAQVFAVRRSPSAGFQVEIREKKNSRGIARRPLSERWCFNFNLCCLLSSRGKHAPKRGERISKSPSDSKEAGRCREEGERGETTNSKMGLKSERGKRDRGQGVHSCLFNMLLNYLTTFIRFQPCIKHAWWQKLQLYQCSQKDFNYITTGLGCTFR